MPASVKSYRLNSGYGPTWYHYVTCDDCGVRTRDQDWHEEALALARAHVCGEGEWPPWSYPEPAEVRP